MSFKRKLKKKKREAKTGLHFWVTIEHLMLQNLAFDSSPKWSHGCKVLVQSNFVFCILYIHMESCYFLAEKCLTVASLFIQANFVFCIKYIYMSLVISWLQKWVTSTSVVQSQNCLLPHIYMYKICMSSWLENQSYTRLVVEFSPTIWFLIHSFTWSLVTFTLWSW